mmetsp:Transcript_9824/g.21971  ORF Transcript_9824/g.21971 Transcript_9824/m.21971 type:complete len:138 (+) Transcript_9824:2371-2784(+)
MQLQQLRSGLFILRGCRAVLVGCEASLSEPFPSQPQLPEDVSPLDLPTSVDKGLVYLHHLRRRLPLLPRRGMPMEPQGVGRPVSMRRVLVLVPKSKPDDHLQDRLQKLLMACRLTRMTTLKKHRERAAHILITSTVV